MKHYIFQSEGQRMCPCFFLIFLSLLQMKSLKLTLNDLFKTKQISSDFNTRRIACGMSASYDKIGGIGNAFQYLIPEKKSYKTVTQQCGQSRQEFIPLPASTFSTTITYFT